MRPRERLIFRTRSSPRQIAWGRLITAVLVVLVLALLIRAGETHAQTPLSLRQAPTGRATAAWPADSFAVLCFHDIRDDLLERPDTDTVETRQLALDFAWLQGNGYHVISLDDVIAARRDHRPLPPRAVLLSFDDGLVSVYTRAFPLLKAFHYPAIVGLVGAWRNDPSVPELVHYGDSWLPRSDFLSDDQVHEMDASGLIEFASHTFDLHHGVRANPQGNLEPDAVSLRFDPVTDRYEAAPATAARTRSDLERNSAVITAISGRLPRVIVWPYGAYDRASEQIAGQLGMPYGLTLEDGLNTPDVALTHLRRILVTHDVTTRELAWALQNANRPAPMREMHVDLDYVYDADPIQQEANLSLLLDRVKAMGVNTVFLQGYADPAGSGTASALYFPNRRLPMRADLLNRTAWQLRTRTGVAVFVWMPLLAFDLPASDPAHDHWVSASESGKGGDVKRLSPFDPLVRQAVRDIYQDLSSQVAFQGLLFSDDATLNDYEDASPAALAVYQSWGLPGDVAAIRASAQSSRTWSQHKSAYLTQFSLELAQLVKADHNDLLTARNIFALVVMNPDAQDWLGQSMDEALSSYDHVALMAMPYLEEERHDPQAWLAQLVERVAAYPMGLRNTVFELQSVDWARQGQPPVPGRLLAQQMQSLRYAGAQNFGYYPDDFLKGNPPIDAIRPWLSVKTFPGTD